MEDTTMTKLRQRMIDDMNLAGLSSRTQGEYIRAVRQLVKNLQGLSGPNLRRAGP